MQVLLLATDEQRTLPPLTDSLPAPLLPVIDRPVMATTIEVLARAGIKQVLVSLYERGSQIASFFGTGSRWGLEIRYLTQRQAWGSAGALRFASGLLSETLLVLPGDALLDLDLEAALAFHRAHGGSTTAMLHRSSGRWGTPEVKVDTEGRVLSLGTGESSLAATGAYIFEPAVLRQIAPGGAPDLTRDLLPALLAGGERVQGYTMDGYWNPLNSVAAFHEAQQVYLYSAYRQSSPEPIAGGPSATVRFPSLEARQVAPGVWVGRDHSIHPSVQIAPPLYIGANSWIGREVELGPNSVIGADVVIDDEATVSGSTVLNNTYVGRLVRVEQRIVAPGILSDIETGETTRVVDPFLVSHVGGTRTNRTPIRRVASFLLTVSLLLLLSPALLALAIIAGVTTGSVFTRLPRVGQRLAESGELKRFQLLRFRTRRADGQLAPLGRFMERWELNRLAELLTVLRGDLALVGVKPLRWEEVAQLTEEWHQRRHERPAGFTGLWYVQTEQSSDLDSVIVTDVYYTATRSWRGDLMLLLRSPAAWMRRALVGTDEQSEREYQLQADNVQSM